MTNAILAEWDGPHGLPRFPAIADADLGPAIDEGLAEARRAVAEIAAQDAAPTFENTIAALERADRPLGRALSIFYTLVATDANPAREALQRETAPKLAAYSSEVVQNRDLFARIDALHRDRERLGLDAEQDRVLYLYHRDFVRAGAALEGDARERLAEITARLATLGTSFAQNVLADERAWQMELPEDAVAELPGFVAEAARAAGRERGVGGPVVTLSRSLIVPFLQFSPRRELRRQAYNAWAARGRTGGETDNRAILAETLDLRHERARLLGFDSYADWKLETQMAGTPGAVRELLEAVWTPACAAAEADAAALTERLHADGVNGALEPWDWRYYAEARRRDEFALNEAELKPYFCLDRMIDAAMTCAYRLFGLVFEEVDPPLHHIDARAWTVRRKGRPVGLFVGDYHARAGKRSGAWCSALRSQRRHDGPVRPIVVNVCNFARSAAGESTLLSYDDARTLFHEFGHALHQLLSDVTYERVSGTSVARDFVELPSQLYEHWLEVPEVLREFATHKDTGKSLPKALRQRLLAATSYDTGFRTVEYLASAMVDLDFHSGAAPADPMARQAEVLEAAGMPAAITMRHAAPHFAHIFAGEGYAAGYYSYMWSEMMDADAFAAFEEAGPFDAETAAGLERHILSAGGSAEADALYVAFRGRMPGIAPLLRNRGLDDAA